MSAPRPYKTDPFRPPALYHQFLYICLVILLVLPHGIFIVSFTHALLLEGSQLFTVTVILRSICLPHVYGWPFVAKLLNVYFCATIYIDSTSTLDIFIQRLYSFNFNTGYFCARQIFIQLQRPKL